MCIRDSSSPVQAYGPTSYVTTWKTDNLTAGSSATNQIAIPVFGVTGDPGYNFEVLWGDGCSDQIVSGGSPAINGDIVHTYDGTCTTTYVNDGGLGVFTITPISGVSSSSGDGTYTVEIDNQFPRIYFAGGNDKAKLLSVDQWGDINWAHLSNSYNGLCLLYTSPSPRD